MATAEKLNYLLETKAKLKNAINDDISLINENTIFREYPNKISSLSDRLKSYIPTGIKTGASIQINNAAPLNVKSLVVDGNSYQITTTGKNEFNKELIISVDLGTYENDVVISDTITNSSVQNVRVRFSEPFKYKANTTYYFSADVRLKSGSGNLNKISDSYVDSEKVKFQRYVTKKTYSDSTNYAEGRLLFQIAANSSELVIEIKNIMISTSEDETFEIYTNGASPNPDYPQKIEVANNLKLINSSKNLFDIDTILVGKVIDNEGNCVTAGLWNISDYIEIDDSNIAYSMHTQGLTAKNTILAQFDSNKNFIKRTASSTSKTEKLETKLTLEENTKYVILGYRNDQNIFNIQLEKGSVATEYESYHKNEYSIDLQDNFLAKTNDAKDTLNLTSGILNKNIKKIVLDGVNIKAIKGTSTYNKKYEFIFDFDNAYRTADNNMISNILCDKLIARSRNETYGSVLTGGIELEGVAMPASQNTYYGTGCVIYRDKWANYTVDQVNEDLQSDPLMLYYQVAETETIQLEPMNIKMYEGTNNIKLISNLETNMQLEYYKDYNANSEVVSEVIE